MTKHSKLKKWISLALILGILASLLAVPVWAAPSEDGDNWTSESEAAYGEEWSGEDGEDLVEPEGPAETDPGSDPAPDPDPTEDPELTPEPEPPEDPELTPEPEPTEDPDPDPTEDPELTPEPEPTEDPELTPEPEPTEDPELTPEPEETETPLASDEPEETEGPDVWEDPEETDDGEEPDDWEDDPFWEEFPEDEWLEDVDPEDLDPEYSVSYLEYGHALVGRADVSSEYDRDENLARIYDYLLAELRLKPAAACGVLANIRAESDGNPRSAGEEWLSYGICRWHTGRLAAMMAYCRENGYDYQSLEGQLYFLKYELTVQFPDFLKELKAIPDTAEGAYDAGHAWCLRYEAAADRWVAADARGAAARDELFPARQEDVHAFVRLSYDGGAGVRTRLLVREGERYGVLPRAERPGYLFDGWFTEPDGGGRKIYALTPVTAEEPVTLYAAWTVDEDGPGDEAAPEEPEPPQADPSIGTGVFESPVAYENVASNYGWRVHPIYNYWRFHAGTDLSAWYGQEIYAADNGTVIVAGCDPKGYGNYVVIDHNNGYQTLYAHQSELAVELGDTVSQGQVIGYVGDTGAATGPHLHYEVWRDYSTVEPTDFL